MQSASAFAATLARQQVVLKIQPSARDYEDQDIRCASWFQEAVYISLWNRVNKASWPVLSVLDSLAVVVEDSSSSCCVTVKVFPHMTTAALKQQVRDCNLPSLFVLFNRRALNWNYIIQCCLFLVPGVSGVWLSPVGAALGDRPVSVRGPALPCLLWSSSGWWHCLPVPAFSPPCTFDSEGSSARPGECPTSQFPISVCTYSPTHYYLYRWACIFG